jgi:hypothetical protein
MPDALYHPKPFLQPLLNGATVHPTLIIETNIRTFPSDPRSPKFSLEIEHNHCSITGLWKVIEDFLAFVDLALLGLLCSKE